MIVLLISPWKVTYYTRFITLENVFGMLELTARYECLSICVLHGNEFSHYFRQGHSFWHNFCNPLSSCSCKAINFLKSWSLWYETVCTFPIIKACVIFKIEWEHKCVSKKVILKKTHLSLFYTPFNNFQRKPTNRVSVMMTIKAAITTKTPLLQIGFCSFSILNCFPNYLLCLLGLGWLFELLFAILGGGVCFVLFLLLFRTFVRQIICFTICVKPCKSNLPHNLILNILVKST